MKRNKKHMDEVLNLVRAIWIQHPELRLTQLMQNCFGTSDIYYIEDEQLCEHLKIVYGVRKDEKSN
jgi:uncharacterized protein YihD (DUF1040 family)